MKPQYEPKSREQFYGYLIEECGEVLHAAGKTLRWGEHSVNPEITPAARESNLVWLKRELADLRDAIDRIEGWIAREFD
jgi:NTP pyrophosphatase (non-canonical NTP hydrolase)